MSWRIEVQGKLADVRTAVGSAEAVIKDQRQIEAAKKLILAELDKIALTHKSALVRAAGDESPTQLNSSVTVHGLKEEEAKHEVHH